MNPFSLGPWNSAPHDPKQIIGGTPVMRNQSHAAGSLSSGFWECTAGHFNWHYDADESIYFLEGSALVRDHAGDAWHELSAGDSITFTAGSTYEWIVNLYVRKFWVIGPRPSLLQRLIRRVRS